MISDIPAVAGIIRRELWRGGNWLARNQRLGVKAQILLARHIAKDSYNL